jgi:hypothetical protein
MNYVFTRFIAGKLYILPQRIEVFNSMRTTIIVLLVFTIAWCSTFRPRATGTSVVHSTHQRDQKGKASIVGRVTDSHDGEPLPFANVIVRGTDKGAATDIDGNYTLADIQPGKYIVSVSLIGYEPCSSLELIVKENAIVVLDFVLVFSKVGPIELN